MPPKRTYLYEQIVEDVIDMVCDMNLEPGDRLPSEQVLSKNFKCNALTIRKSLALMVDRQILEKRPGSGTYLRTPVEKIKVRKTSKVDFCPSNLMAMIIPPEMDNFLIKLFNSVINICVQKGIELVIHPLQVFDDDSLPLASQLNQRGCQAVMILGIPDGTDSEKLKQFISLCDIPVVLNRKVAGLEHLVYEYPGRNGIYSRREMRFSCRYLKELGYQNIVYICDELEPSQLASRVKIEEYQKCMVLYGMRSFLECVDKRFSNIDDIIARFVPQKGHTAIICYDDDYAIRLMTSLYKRGFSVPEDFALLGSNDNKNSAFTEPPLSTFRFPYEFLAESFVSAALARSQQLAYSEIPIPALAPVIRDSCGGKVILGNQFNHIINKIQRETENEVG